MFPHTPDQVAVAGLAIIGLTLAVAAPTFAPSADEPLAAEAAAGPAVATGLSVTSDTMQVGDRRCLTRRPEDCLDKPVPLDEPHGAVCAVCHDLWENRELKQTARSCSGGECHANPAELSSFHKTVPSDVLGQCVACHTAHDFRVKGAGQDCLVCHNSGGSPVTWAGAAAPLSLPAGLDFTHTDHDGLGCATCHGVQSTHGTLNIMGREDCRTCHHNQPLVQSCTTCHVVDEVRETSFAVTKPLNIIIGSLDRPVRTITFHHSDHWQHTQCSVCHTGGIDLETARGADCSGCHLEHHEPTATCTTCHEAPKPGAHDRSAHMGCGGTGCHDPVPAGIAKAPRTRELCLVCHQDRLNHEVGKNCADCHVLPPTT